VRFDKDSGYIPGGIKLVYPLEWAKRLLEHSDLWNTNVPLELNGIISVEKVNVLPDNVPFELRVDMAEVSENVVQSILYRAESDFVVVQWDTWFEGAVGGYNGVALGFNTTFPQWEHQPEERQLVIFINYKTILDDGGGPDDLAAGLSERVGYPVQYIYTE